MVRYTKRDVIWDLSFKQIFSGEAFTAGDIIDDATVTLSLQKVTEVLEVMANFGWVEEQTESDGLVFHPCVELKADAIPSTDSSEEQSETDSNSEAQSAPEAGDQSDSNSESTESSSEGSQSDETQVEDSPETREREDSADDGDEVATLDGITRPSDLTEGQVYIGTVDRVPSNALIELPNGHVNLGPISEDAEGEEVRFKSSGGTWGRCLDEEYTYPGYSPRSDGSSPSKSQTRARNNSKKTSVTDPSNKNKLLNGLR